MLKVFGFIRRHPRLTHDEYRAGHVGYHNSFGRRLNHIRGYLLNVNANSPIHKTLGKELIERITFGEPEGFDDQWDGWGQLFFDNYEDYVGARVPARDWAGPNGLSEDEMVGKVGGDFDDLYAGSPFQFHVNEHIAKPVIRPERKIFKMVQFAKRRPDLPKELFEAYWSGRYASHVLTMPGLRGLVMNFRTELDVMTKFFAPDTEGFTEAGIKRRETFYEGWDGMAEYWFDDASQYSDARANHSLDQTLSDLEQKMFSHVFYREVDETVAVLPKRTPAPDFYYR
jgi:hypothetical protein